jgi:hypothetical protein
MRSPELYAPGFFFAIHLPARQSVIAKQADR